MMPNGSVVFIKSRAVQLSAAIFLIVIVVFRRLAGYDFVTWDDVQNVCSNIYFQPVNIHSLGHLWTHPYYGLYVPVSYTAYACLSLLASHGAPSVVSEFGSSLNPHVFHSANIVLHACNAVLAFLILRRAVKLDVAAFFGALLFALHPLQVESVAWISELRGLLGGTFSLAAVLAYQRGGEISEPPFNKLRITSVVLFALSLLSKPDWVVMPVVMLVWESWIFRKPVITTFVNLIPWFVLAASDTIVTHLAQPLGQSVALPLWERPIIAIDSFGFYLEKLLWPVNLAIQYGRTPALVLKNHCAVTTGAVFAWAAALCIAFGRERRWLLASALTFLIFLLPVSGITPFGYQFYSTVADRYAYPAMLGPALSLSFALAGLRPTSLRSAAQYVTAAILCLLVVRTSIQISTWRNTITLFSHAARVDPGDWSPHEQLGSDFLRLKDFTDAETQYRYVVEHAPRADSYWLNYGRALQGQGRYAEAINAFTQSLAIDRRYPAALYSRAQCEALSGETSRSLADYRLAVKLLPPNTYADYELAMELASVGRCGEAVPEFIKTLQIHPDDLDAYYYLAMTYSRLRQPKLAQDVAEIALARDPHYAPVLQYASFARKKLGRN